MNEKEKYIKEKLQLLYNLINHDIFDSTLPAPVFVLSNQGVQTKKRVKYQAIKSSKGIYNIKVSKSNLVNPKDLAIFIVQQALIIYLNINEGMSLDQSRLGLPFRDGCEQFDVVVGGDVKNGFYLEEIDNTLCERYSKFISDDKWIEYSRYILNVGIIENGKLRSRNMIFYICPECFKLAKGLPKTKLICKDCMTPLVTTDEFIEINRK